MSRLRAAVVGATGIAGQQFLASLAGHPLFAITALAASPRSAGKTYREAITSGHGALQWFCSEPLDDSLAGLVVQDAGRLDPTEFEVIFTAMESDAAREHEPRYAAATPVLSTASAFRYEPDVPLLTPGVNPEHMPLLRVQQRRRGWKGFIAPNSNCTCMGLAITLAPLHAAFGVQSVIMTSLQAVSGAGRSPGVIGLDILDNVIPHIVGEEQKVEAEAKKILGTLAGETIAPAPFAVSASCTRVPVLEAHTETVNVSLGRPATVDEVKAAMRAWAADFCALGHPSSPGHLITVLDDPFRPQPRLDRDREQGMTTTVGRVRACGVLPHGIKYVLVSHNTKMAAARGAVLMAEELHRRGYLGG